VKFILSLILVPCLCFAPGVFAQLAKTPEMALIAAAEEGDTADVRRLLAAGVGINTRDARGRTALLAATHANRIETARLLIDAGADVNAQDAIKDSPFLYAGAQGRLEILRLMLSGTRSRPDFKLLNRYGGNALIPACHYGHVETVRELLKTDIPVDFVNSLGWTALLETVILGDGSARYVEITKLLLARGATVNLPDRDGVTPLAHALRRGQKAVAEVLRAAGGKQSPALLYDGRLK